MVQVDKKKLKVLKDIAEEVNENANKIKGIKNDALVVVSDIEGRAKDFLVKLKHTGVIDSVDVEEKTGKLKICLNKDFCGTIDFCGDLTAYKVLQPFRNEIVIEVFEELLAQIKEHNKNKEKDKQIQFVAVPGNHEFYNFWGGPDSVIMASSTDGDKGPLLIKLKSLKVIAEIQKYFLEQAQTNGDDIKDEDYDDYDDNTDNNTYITEKKEALQNDIDWLDCHISNIISCKEKNLQATDYILNEIDEIVRSGKMPNTFNTLLQFNWSSSALLPKIVFSHHGRKFRILHSFALFTPEEYLKLDNSRKNNAALRTIYVDDQQQIFKNAFKQGVRNVAGVDIKDFPDKSVFANNKIPTFVGHEGTKRKKDDFVGLKQQSPLAFCVDETNFTPSGYTHIVDDDNFIKGYMVYQGKNMRDWKMNDNDTYQKRKVGDLVQDEQQKMAIYWTDRALQSHISSYIDTGDNDKLVANAMNELHNRNSVRLNDENYLKYKRWLAFSGKDKRAQQVYQTYKQTVDNPSVDGDNMPQLVDINSINSINTPCGGCF